ncbi:hypothetical protein LUTEI9C_140223 [Luteimonas sp. 9C]|nr:hypothetical protein LUTEI9C_140223 [Luteimonas sp. 9C]
MVQQPGFEVGASAGPACRGTQGRSGGRARSGDGAGQQAEPVPGLEFPGTRGPPRLVAPPGTPDAGPRQALTRAPGESRHGTRPRLPTLVLPLPEHRIDGPSQRPCRTRLHARSGGVRPVRRPDADRRAGSVVAVRRSVRVLPARHATQSEGLVHRARLRHVDSPSDAGLLPVADPLLPVSTWLDDGGDRRVLHLSAHLPASRAFRSLARPGRRHAGAVLALT